MRILVVSQYFWPENFRINDWVDGMVERGHEITVLTSLPNYPKGILLEAFKNAPEQFNKYKNVEIVRVPQILRGNSPIQLFLNYISFAFFGATVGVWKLRGKRFDVSFVFAISPILMVIPAIAIKFFKKTPILLWVLDLWPDVLKSVGIVKSEKTLSILRHGVAFLYNRCDCVVGQSQTFLEDIKKTSPLHKNTAFIPSWSEDMNLDTNNIELENLIISKKSSFNIFYTGNLGEAQDFPTVIEAAKLLSHNKDIKWFIVGDGRRKAYIETEIKNNNLSDVFYLLGQHPIETMPVFFKHANAALLCLKNDDSLCKTIPGKLQTYCSFGVAIIGSADGEVYKIVNENKLGLIAAGGDSKMLVDNILSMKRRNILEIQEISTNTKLYYKKYFERSAVLNAFEKKLLEIMKCPS